MAARTKRWDIAEILDRTDLAALLDEHTSSQGEGHRRRWHCPAPDHHDQHPSVTIAADAHGHERWRCWSGDDTHRGDAIDLIMLTHRTDRAAAIAHLAERAGIGRDEPTRPRAPHRTTPKEAGPVPLDDAVRRYVAACENVLWSRFGRPVRAWLHDRGLTDETLHAHHIGADPGRQMLRRPGGLPSGRALAATFPALSPTGDITYVQTRYLDPGDGPKYENPASKLGTNPRLAWTQRPVPDEGPLVVCEGIPDALTARQSGFTTVAILGAQAPDPSVADALAAYAHRRSVDLIAVIDDDPAGHAWGTRLDTLISERGSHITVIAPPGGLDLNAWALTEPEWPAVLRAPHRASVDPPAFDVGVEL
jgi:DNA primase